MKVVRGWKSMVERLNCKHNAIFNGITWQCDYRYIVTSDKTRLIRKEWRDNNNNLNYYCIDIVWNDEDSAWILFGPYGGIVEDCWEHQVTSIVTNKQFSAKNMDLIGNVIYFMKQECEKQLK